MEIYEYWNKYLISTFGAGMPCNPGKPGSPRSPWKNKHIWNHYVENNSNIGYNSTHNLNNQQIEEKCYISWYLRHNIGMLTD